MIKAMTHGLTSISPSITSYEPQGDVKFQLAYAKKVTIAVKEVPDSKDLPANITLKEIPEKANSLMNLVDL